MNRNTMLIVAASAAFTIAIDAQAGIAAEDRTAEFGPPNIQQVDAPDVPGGYASTHIIIQVQPATAPTREGGAGVPAGLWTIDAVDARDRTPEMLVDSFLLMATFSVWQVSDIRRGVEPANAELAAQRAELDGIGGITVEVIPNDDLFPQQWALKNTGQTGGTAGADISAMHGWSIYNDANDESIIIAILDSGVHAEHEDMQGRVIDGWNFIDDNDDPYDVHGHGTFVAGIAGASTNNAVGIAGVSWGARIMPVKVLGDGGTGSWFAIGDGVIFAADNGAHVANMSIQGGFSIYMESAVQYGHQSGMLLVAASGNSGAGNIRYPGLYPETIAVGATDRNDNVPSFSSTGPQLSVAAPGVSILSLDVPTGYRLNSGTSMAAPHVAGLARLLISQDPMRTHEDVWQIIEATADSRGGPGHNFEYGWGRINAATALQWASAIHVPDDHSTIQAAIDFAADGAMIVVAPGTYHEAIDFGDKSIHLRSWNKPLSTIIDASGLGTSAVTISGGSDATLHGFTITGGSGTLVDGQTYGGGVYIAGSSPTITGNRFLYNTADEGGAIFADGASSPGIGVSFFCRNEPSNITGSWQNLGDITFGQGPCEAVIATLVDYAVNQGNALTSGLWLLEESDNEYLEIQSVHSSGGHRTSTTVEALSPSSDVTELDLTIETGTTVNGVNTFIDLWNFSSGSWTALDSFSQPQADTIKEYAIGDPNAHSDGDGLIRVRLRTEAQMNPNSGGYIFRIDHVQFIVLDEEPQAGPIQQLIDAASDGDVIVIEPGVYNEAIDLKGKAITLRSTDPDDPDIVAATVIDGIGMNRSVITINSGEGPDTVIAGLTITGGTGTHVDNATRGGGMYIVNASPTITNCVFIHNSATRGGGMFNLDSSSQVTNCQFIENHVFVGDGGMYNSTSSPTVVDCLFLGNTSDGSGSGMSNVTSSSPTVLGCTFEKNASTNQDTMLNSTSSATVTDSIFSNNSAGSSAAGLFGSSGSSFDLSGTTISDNAGTAVHLVFDSHVTLENSIIENNAAMNGVGGLRIDSDGSATISNSLICNNESSDISGPKRAVDHNTRLYTSIDRRLANLHYASNLAMALAVRRLDHSATGIWRLLSPHEKPRRRGGVRKQGLTERNRSVTDTVPKR